MFGGFMVKVLFVCIHNSARSQMAEAFVNASAKGRIVAQSAGLTPGRLNPVVVAAMSEIGIDISQNKTKGVSDFLDRGEIFDYVVAVCDEASAERCPSFPGKAQKLHWAFEDPSAIGGTDEEKMSGTRAIRDQIRSKVDGWVNVILQVKA
jgi:arsenate reductase